MCQYEKEKYDDKKEKIINSVKLHFKIEFPIGFHD